jgi:IS30 family transposase
VGRPRLTDEYTTEIWERYKRGQTAAVIARVLGRHPTTTAEFIREAGGIRPPCPRRSDKRLSLAEREQICRGLAAGQSLRAIAKCLGRAPWTISREINRNGGRARYRTLGAHDAAHRRARRPKPCKRPRTGSCAHW